MGFLIVVLLIVLSIWGISFLFKLREKKYIDFLLNNSVTLLKLLSTNKKYSFIENIKNYNDSHTYDNEIFFTNISCQDYLIYQLQFKKYDIEKDIKNIQQNNIKFSQYTKEISEIKSFGEYKTSTEKLNTKYLLKLEKQLFNQYFLSPKLKFEIKIILYCSKINGRIYAKKQQTFYAEEILVLIKRLNNKNGQFYNDRGIWDALCRVERGKVSNKMRFAIYKRDGYRCCHCGRTETSVYLEIDHIQPISKGGKSTYDNLQTLCRRCNKEKGNRF